MQYRYYKGAQRKGVWRVVEVDKEGEQLQHDSTQFATVLSVNEGPGRDGSVSEDALYQGPFYIDIDSDSIAKAIKAAKSVLNKLLANKVNEKSISIYATGKRGFHFLVPMVVFAVDQPTHKLPLTYRHMSLALQLPDETDMTVYSGGKGRMWRLPNKKREDNGNYKVQITGDELREMTPESYDIVVKEPREEWPPVLARSTLFRGLYKLAKGRAEAAVKPKALFVDPESREQLGGNLPPCAEYLLHGQKIRAGKGFNDISMQFAKAVVAFSPQNANELVSQFAENTKGNTYNTVKKRKDHCSTAVKIASRNSQYEWSCRSALSVILHEPCYNCPIAYLRTRQEDEMAAHHAEKAGHDEPQQDAPGATTSPGPRTVPRKAAPVVEGGSGKVSQETVTTSQAPDVEQAPAAPGVQRANPELVQAAAEMLRRTELGDDLDTPEPPEPEQKINGKANGHLNGHDFADDDEDIGGEGLVVTEDGFGFYGDKGVFRRISNFTMRLSKYYLEFIPNLNADRRVAVMAEIAVKSRHIGSVMLEENAWNSKASLIGFLGGLSNVGFIGKDEDVQKMKMALMSRLDSGAEQIRRVRSCGIHRAKIGTQHVFTYVEPGWSIDQYGNENKYFLAGRIDGHPKLQYVPEPDPQRAEVYDDLLWKLMHVNKKENMGPIFGWFMASFFKQHIRVYRNEFPLLGLHGTAGSGKTSTANLLMAIHGCDFQLECSPTAMPSARPFAVWKSISESTTVPRLMEEFNRSKVKMYDDMAEVFKDCWNSMSIKRGVIASNKSGNNGIGAEIQEYPLTAPVIMFSEQSIQLPALVQRTVQVSLAPKDITGELARNCYDECVESLPTIFEISKAFYLKALQISVEDVRTHMESFRKLVPLSIGERPNYSYRVVLTGLKLFCQMCYDMGWRKSATFGEELIGDLIEQLTNDQGAIAMLKKRSEIDIVIQKMAAMAGLSKKEGGAPWFMPRQHYLVADGYLYLDMLVCHAQYVRYMSQIEHNRPVIQESKQFYELVKDEPYYAGIDVIQGFADSRPCVKLNIDIMIEKGVEAIIF